MNIKQEDVNTLFSKHSRIKKMEHFAVPNVNKQIDTRIW